MIQYAIRQCKQYHATCREELPTETETNCWYLTAEMKWCMITKKEYNLKVREFWKQMSEYIMTSRFNSDTIRQNRAFCEKQKRIRCIYCCPQPVLAKIPLERNMFVLEMNNDTNRIVGIGLVKNRYYTRKYQVYDNMNYNRFAYVGKDRIDRLQMTPAEDIVMQWLERFCFKGANHMKRGQGMTSFPVDLLFHISPIINIVDFMREMFNART